MRLAVNFVTVRGRYHQSTDVPTLSLSSAAETARNSVPPFPTTFRADNSFLDAHLVPSLQAYCQSIDTSNQVAELFGPSGIIRDAERTARREPFRTSFEGKQGVLTHIKGPYMDSVNNLIQEDGIGANEALEGGLRDWVVEGLGRTLKTDIFLTVGGRRRVVLVVKSPKVAPIEVFGIINQAPRTDSYLSTSIPVSPRNFQGSVRLPPTTKRPHHQIGVFPTSFRRRVHQC